MTQILESTRNYLKSSTKLGRRMSGSRDEISGSETSLHSSAHENIPKDGNSRSSTKERFSGDFVRETRSKSPTFKDAPSPRTGPSHHGDIKSGDVTLKRNKSLHSTKSRGRNDTINLDHDCVSEHMENEVPRGLSPTLSMSNTFSTAASSYDMRPTDYPNIRQYQAHVWRRNLLEESIMHSLRLGYSDRHRPPSRHHSQSSRIESPRRRKSRGKAIITATGKDLPPFPALDDKTASHENIIDRSLKIIDSNSRSQTMAWAEQQPQQFRRENNSPYQLDYNTSMTNITQSFASFTLELPEHQASHIMRSSVIPDLFRIKAIIPGAWSYQSRSRRNSRASSIKSFNSGIAPSSRVLTGRKPVMPLPQLTLPDVKDEDEDPESPLTPTSAGWADSVIESFDEVTSSRRNSMDENRLQTLEMAPACAV
ncbi:hypothetical protein BGX27_003740 [Mortierella sp. AM989]|nr:hypothetical protein BGX27_003740 [Mortierella sp. AM989]